MQGSFSADFFTFGYNVGAAAIHFCHKLRVTDDGPTRNRPLLSLLERPLAETGPALAAGGGRAYGELQSEIENRNPGQSGSPGL